MLPKNNNKAVLATLALMLLSLSVASSIDYKYHHIMQTRKACLKALKESKVTNQYPEPSQQTQVSLLLLMPLPQWKAAVMQPMPLPQELVMQPMPLPQELVMQPMPLPQELVMQPMPLPQELVMQPMPLPQAMAEQPPAIKLAVGPLALYGGGGG